MKKNSLKRSVLSLLLALILLLQVGVCTAFAAKDKTAFVPVMRFIAASDTHIKENDDTNTKRISKMMKLAYDLSDRDPAYQKLDAVLIAGDLTDRGTKPAFDIFWNTLSSSLREGTQFLGVVAKNHDGYELSRTEERSYYSSLTGNDADFHTVIGGYHFIGLSVSSNKLYHYDFGQLTWLKKQLDAAVAEDPNKPVFVTHHEPARGTVYGSSLYDGWGVPYFKPILDQYPQVVDIAGHSHYPLNDPRSIWQGNFTELNTGAIYYAEFTIDTYRAYDPADCFEVGTFWIVELDARHNMRLRGFDVEAGTQLIETFIKNPADKNNRDYTPAKRKAEASAPAFSKKAQLKITPTFGGCEVEAPYAKSTDGMPIVLYRIQAYDAFGALVAKDWALPKYYRASDEKSVNFTVENLAEGACTLRVVAENAYGMQSAPLEAKITVSGKNVFEAFLDRVVAFFQHIVEFFKILFN